MEEIRSKKLHDHNTLLAKCYDDKMKVETERDGLLKILSQAFQTREQICLCQGVYNCHLNFLLSVNANTRCPQIKSIAKKVSRLLQNVDKFIHDVSFFSEQLRVINVEQMSFMNALKEKRKLIENSMTLNDLNGISFGTPFSMNSVDLSHGNEMEREYRGAMELRDKITKLGEVLRRLTDEERAQLTCT